MKKIFFNLLVFSSLACFSNESMEENSELSNVGYCDEAMFDAMDWAAEAGLDNQQISNAGNAAYAECWLMNRNLIRDSGQGVD